VVEAPAILAPGDSLMVRSAGGGRIAWSTRTEGPLDIAPGDRVVLRAEAARRRAARLVSVPTGLSWRHSKPGLPSAMVLRCAEVDGIGRQGPQRLYTGLFTDHGALPVVSIVLPEDAWFHPDSGLQVTGHALLHATPRMDSLYAADPRWWKYPGNFHFTGKAWERRGRLELILPGGQRPLETAVRVRVNGRTTRAFPQRALRLLFDEPLTVPLFADGDGPGTRALVLRSAGNDQVKAMMRDAYLSGLCQGLPFEVSRSRTCVAYLNGAYWGLYHLRQRMDERELARRHGIAPKRVRILDIEDTADPKLEGDGRTLKRLAREGAAWDGRDSTFLRNVDAFLDTDAFLTYMAAMMVVGNRDWPKANVRLWRHTGKPGPGPLDGRYRPIMNDTDLGFGANAPPTADLYAQVRKGSAPIPDLFNALLRDPALHARFEATLLELIEGPLSTARCLQHLDSLANLMAPEMERHIARWRLHAGREAWWREVEVMRRYAVERPVAVHAALRESQLPDERP
jgi:hypothetical protein